MPRARGGRRAQHAALLLVSCPPPCGQLEALSACCITEVSANNQGLVPCQPSVPRGTCALVENPAVPTGGKLA